MVENNHEAERNAINSLIDISDEEQFNMGEGYMAYSTHHKKQQSYHFDHSKGLNLRGQKNKIQLRRNTLAKHKSQRSQMLVQDFDQQQTQQYPSKTLDQKGIQAQIDISSSANILIERQHIPSVRPLRRKLTPIKISNQLPTQPTSSEENLNYEYLRQMMERQVFNLQKSKVRPKFFLESPLHHGTDINKLFSLQPIHKIHSPSEHMRITKLVLKIPLKK